MRAGVSRSTVSRVEADAIDDVTVGALRKVADALGAGLVLDLRWHGPDLDRLLDAHHAALQEWLAGFLGRQGWLVRVEVSFNHYGDRGRCDLLAYHGASRAMLVVEVKTAVADVQDLFGRLDVKLRVAGTVAAQLGWQPLAVAPLLLLAEGTTPRRHVESHPTLFARFAVRGRAAIGWLWRPSSAALPSGLLIFRKLPYARRGDGIAVRRVRKPRTPATQATGDHGTRSRS